MKRKRTWKTLTVAAVLTGLSLVGVGLATHNATDDELGGALGAIGLGAGLATQTTAEDQRSARARHLPLRAIWRDRL